MDTLLTAYLAMHAALALLIDAQSVLPDLAPSVLSDMVGSRTTGD